jgi:hypothetical protein
MLTPALRKILFGGIRPSLSLDFLSGATPGGITFSGGANGTRVNSAGTLVAATTPRFDYDPVSLAPKGLLVEEARTNSIRNNTMAGAVAGTPGTLTTNWVDGLTGVGLTRTIVGTGVVGGITYIEIRWAGTTTTTSSRFAFDTNTAIAATSGQSWTNSAYLAIVGGSFANVTSIHPSIYCYRVDGVTTSESFSGANLKDTLTGSLARSEKPATLVQALTTSVRGGLELTFASGVALDFTLRIGLPQLELGSFATSAIQTSTAAVTRTADSAVMTGSNFSSWYRQDGGTLVVEIGDAVVPTTGSTTPMLASINDASANNRIALIQTATARRLLVNSGGGAVATIDVTGTSAVKMAAVFAANRFNQASNGTLGTEDTAGALPVAPSQLNIGSDRSGLNTICAHVKSVKFYRPLADSAMQRLTP